MVETTRQTRLEAHRQAEAAILAIVRREHRSRPVSIIERVTGQGLPNAAVRLALWSLIDRDQVRFAPDRCLMLPATGCDPAIG